MDICQIGTELHFILIVWHIYCILLIFVLNVKLYWADGLNTFWRRRCPPGFFYRQKKEQILLEWQDLFHTLKDSYDGVVPEEDDSFFILNLFILRHERRLWRGYDKLSPRWRKIIYPVIR